MPKPTVHYVLGDHLPPALGEGAHVYTLDHPNDPLNHSVYGVRTSKVIRIEDDGTFETLNSIYVKASEEGKI